MKRTVRKPFPGRIERHKPVAKSPSFYFGRTRCRFALADQLEMRLAQARGQMAKLTPFLLARAFAGKLVPQNPADEPASGLLNRLRKTKAMRSHL